MSPERCLRAAKACRSNPSHEAKIDLIRAGFDPLKEPYLQLELAKLQAECNLRVTYV